MGFGRTAALLLAVMLASPAAAVSFEEERDVGAQFALAARQHLSLIDDPEVVGYVNGVGQRIVRALNDDVFVYRFFVVRDANINAFAVPGGYVYVHSGLLGRVGSEEELAAVLAHEIAHVHAHHLAREQDATRLMNYVTLLGVLASVVQPAVGAVAAAAGAANQLSYRREFEQEADYLGARMARRAGYDPRGGLDFFKKLADDQRSVPTFTPPYLRTHPVTDERLTHLEAALRAQQWTARERPARGPALEWAAAVARVRTEPPAETAAAYRRAVAAAPGDAFQRFLLGVVCLEAGEIDAAREALEAARAAGVGDAERELGRLALRARRADEARGVLERVVAAHPDDAAAWSDLGKSLELLGDEAGALRAYRRAVESAPEFEVAQYRLGTLAGRSGLEGDGYFHLATASRLRGEYQAALGQFARAASRLPSLDPRRDEAREWMRQLSRFLRVRMPEEAEVEPSSPAGATPAGTP